MKRYYYSDSIQGFLNTNTDTIIGRLASENTFSLETTQRDAWQQQITLLKTILPPYKDKGQIYFEYSIPRMGQRIDVVMLISSVIFVLEFKIGQTNFTSNAIDQVFDYALDLKNFHLSSRELFIAPILIATDANAVDIIINPTPHNDKVIYPIKANSNTLSQAIKQILNFATGPAIDPVIWESGRYCPTPTIIQAALNLYNKHSVSDITRTDAAAINLTQTTQAISNIIDDAKNNRKKTICFVTGVPGSGKTLVGLNIATSHIDKANGLHCVFLSGNGPLVKILREALARDKVQKEKDAGRRITKKDALRPVKAFIQNVHTFRDEYIKDPNPPTDHVAIFDEAQRAWNAQQTSIFMRRKRKILDFNMSEPQFLISCLDRHKDWAVIVCLVGGGQEIHTGEAGISQWLYALDKFYPDWNIHISPNLTDSEYQTQEALPLLSNRRNVLYNKNLHLSVSMRSFRAENVSLLVKQILDLKTHDAQRTLTLLDKYPIVLTRDLNKAKHWLRTQARGSERYGIVVSSQAERLKPHAIDVKSPMNPIHWFLNDKDDVRSSFYLEHVATEFDIQGLELDWACVTWDADFRYANNNWNHWSFRAKRWNRINKPERKLFLKNAYRVLLTRARQGMIIVVP